MPKAKLSKRTVDGAQHTSSGNYTIYQDTDLPGFGLRVTAAGAKTFIADYRHGGRKRRFAVGRYGPVTVDEARKLAKQALYAVAKGEDPAERKRREREGDTLADVVARYLDDLRARAEAGAKRGRLSGWESACGLVKRHVPAAMLRRKIADVTVEDVRRVHRTLADKAPMADHVRTVLHAVFERALTEGLISTNPAAPVKRYSKPAKRRRALTLDELARLGSVLDGVEAIGHLDGHAVDPAAAATLRLLAMTGMRRSELLGHQTKARRGPREGLRWSDLDLEAGTYALVAHGGGAGGKGGGPRMLPLGTATIDLLRSIKPDDLNPEAPVVASPRDPSEPYRGLDKSRRLIYQVADISGADTHCLRHTFETVAFELAPAYAGMLTGRSLTRDPVLNDYLHVDMARLREVADSVAGRIAAAMASQLADVVLMERRR